jgi:predicted Zn-dependent protease
MLFARALYFWLVGICLFLGPFVCYLHAAAFEVNKDGQQLLLQATQAYDSDMRDRPVLMDAVIGDYVQNTARRLLAQANPLASGVQLSVTVIDSPKPEVYTYVDGHVVVSSGLVFGLDNEAQLAGVLAPQVAHLSEGYYLALYQQIKAKQRRKERTAVAGAIFGVLLDSAVDYTVETQGIEMTEEIMSGEATYGETMKRLAAINAAQGAYYGIKDVIGNMPAKDAQGRAIDPRLQFEPVADAQGMILCTKAGYDPQACARGWENIHRINHAILKQKQQSMGAFAEQMRAQRALMESTLLRLRQQMGDSGLVQTPSHIKASRARFMAGLINMAEVKAAAVGPRNTGKKTYMDFIRGLLLPRAQAALDEEQYEQAHRDFKKLYERGVRTAPVAYGLAKSRLGDFAFGASPAELRAAEKAYREAARLDPSFAEPYRGLAELYSDSDDYEAAVEAWRNYLKRAPKTRDRKKIERKIRILERKAQR